jgi:hypothetical protein
VHRHRDRLHQEGIGCAHAVGQLDDARRVDQQPVGESAVGRHAVQRPGAGRAEVLASHGAVRAPAAERERLDRHRPTVEVGADLVPEREGPGAHVHDVQVGPADPHRHGLDHHALSVGLGHVQHLDALRGVPDGAHCAIR